jgi:hypothetical protein
MARAEVQVKTLGQIAYETTDDAVELPWNQCVSNAARPYWEKMAQAVRAAVIEECAKVCEQTEAGEHAPMPRRLSARDCARAIRALKDRA